jgi:hypothetical protein
MIFLTFGVMTPIKRSYTLNDTAIVPVETPGITVVMPKAIPMPINLNNSKKISKNHNLVIMRQNSAGIKPINGIKVSFDVINALNSDDFYSIV